eukprot:CAMPEP_0114556738 /NCGR_PEP_ID=MMETSP0114-20121206/9448_1 /TAXON_ID=31324 /ORGANISM="Goniomonas sp, Strain m" /LENGTH=406 /DNA_ID=CAMNT_0001741961 /DNA_START=68 /DNA_END=1288 /DNA_ORIENTATION=-
MNVQPTLTNVEAQRVMAVVDELCEDLEWCFRLPPHTLKSQPHLVNLIGGEHRRLFEQQLELEVQLGAIVQQLEGPVSEFIPEKDWPERSLPQEALAQEFIQVARASRRNAREICRTLRANPTLDAMIQSAEGGDAGTLIAGTTVVKKFSKTLAQLRIQTLRGLATSVEEDKAEKEHFEVVAQREKKLAQEAKSLRKDLAAIKHERHKTISIKDEMIIQYKNDLKDLKALTAKAAQTGGRKSEQNEAAQQAFNETKANLLKEIKKREVELERLKLDFKEKEDAMAKRSFKKETDVESWIVKYDQEMANLNNEILSTQVTYSDEKARLRELDDYFDRFRLQEGGERMLVCMHSAVEAEQAAKRNRLDTNATRVQSAIRGHLLRKELLEKAKKGKKGKGKKGKGKGKKK